jgi:ribosomal protein S18 acetylase RimI-like enzyme
LAEPTPFELRPALVDDAGGIARTYIDSWRGAYRGILPDGVLDGMNLERERTSWRRVIASGLAQHRVLVLAPPKGGVAGFLTYGADRSRRGPVRSAEGEVFTLYVAPGHQGRGGGRRLMAGAAEAMRAEGYRSLILWVLGLNERARGFYESLDGESAGERTTSVGGSRLALVGYRWPELEALEEAAARLSQIRLPAPLDRVAPGA